MMPAVRTIQAFRANALALFAEHGTPVEGVAEIDFGVRRAWVVADPAVAVAVLTSPLFAKGHAAYGPLGTFAGFGSLRGLVGPTLPVLDGAEGLERRRLLQPVYQRVLARHAAVGERVPVRLQVEEEAPVLDFRSCINPFRYDGLGAICRLEVPRSSLNRPSASWCGDWSHRDLHPPGPRASSDDPARRPGSTRPDSCRPRPRHRQWPRSRPVSVDLAFRCL